MTNQSLFELMSEIDFDLIERAEAPVPMRKKPVFRVAMIAAALALVLTLGMVSAGVAGTVAVTVRYVDYVEQTYPEFDGTVLHFAQILLTEDQNLLSSLLTDDAKHALGGAIAALRESLGGGGEQSKESTAQPEEDTREPEEDTVDSEDNDTDQMTTEPEQTTQPDQQATEPEITDEPPEQGWSQGLEYTKETLNGKTVYVVSGIGACTDTELYIPPTYNGSRVVAIGENAFYNNYDIVSVTLPSTVVEVRNGAFCTCGMLKSVELSDNLTRIGEDAFQKCIQLKSVVIPAGVKVIEARAFEYCYQLMQVDFLGEPERICELAFAYCTDWLYPIFPDSVKVIESQALANSRMTHFVVPKGVTVLKTYTFFECNSLSSIAIHGDVIEIEDNVVSDYLNLQTVYFQGSRADWEKVKMSAQTREKLTPLIVYHGN